MIAPSYSNNVSRKDNIIITDALFQFILRSGMKQTVMLQMLVYTVGYCYTLLQVYNS